jgi:hypothetical protein
MFLMWRLAHKWLPAPAAGAHDDIRFEWGIAVETECVFDSASFGNADDQFESS